MSKPKFTIPDQLRKQRFIKTHKKFPIESNWTLDTSLYLRNPDTKQYIHNSTGQAYIKNPERIPYTDDKVNNYTHQEIISQSMYSTYGVLCGYNGLIVVDVDNAELEKYLHTLSEFQQTFAVKTANSQMTHFYFYTEDTRHPNTIRVNHKESKERICDVQGVGTQVIGPGSSITCDDGQYRMYEPINNNQIQNIQYSSLKKIFEDFSKTADMPISFKEDTFHKNIKKADNETTSEIDIVCKEIKERITVQKLLESWGIDTSGTLCESPFTQNSKNRASLSYTDQTFYDFHYDIGGSIFHLYMKYKNVDFETAKYELAMLTGVKYDQQNVLGKYFRFFYMTQENNQKFGVLHKEKDVLTQLRKQEIADYIIFNNPNIYEELGVFAKNHTKKRQVLSDKINQYVETDGNIEVVAGFGYRPTNEKVYTFNKAKYINRYQPPKLHTIPIIEDATQSQFPNIAAIIQHLCKNNSVIYNYFLDWLAFQLQHPLVKLPTSFIFMGAHGTGKGILRQFILDYVFGHDNVTEVTQNSIVRAWGDWMVQSRVIFADEINLNSKQHDEVCDRLKNNTTNPYITVDIKRKDSLKMQNFTHWIFTSNKELPFRIEEGDRRYIVVEQLNKLNTVYVENIDPYINKKTHKKEVFSFYSHLMSRKPEFKTLAQPLHTDEKQDLISASFSNTRKFIEDLRSYNTVSDFLSEMQFKLHIVDGFVSTKELYILFKKWCDNNSVIPSNKVNFGRELSKVYDIKSTQKRILDSNTRAFELSEILGRETSPDDIKVNKTNDSTDELSKDMEEFEV